MIGVNDIKLNPTDISNEIKNLLEMFEFYLVERQLDKPIEELASAVRDLRIIIQRLLIHHFLKFEAKEEAKFCTSLASMLAERCEKVPKMNDSDVKYFDYCIGEILVCFEWAQEIKSEFPNDFVAQEALALDIPLLRPFDYGIRSKIHVVASKGRRKM